MTDTEQKLFEQLVEMNSICETMQVTSSFQLFLDAKPWAIGVQVKVNLEQLHEIVQKAYEKGIKVAIHSTDEALSDEWRDPLSNPIKFDLDIEEEKSGIYIDDDDIEE